MFRTRRTNLVSLVIMAIVAIAVGSAFTAANTFDAHAGNQLGYGTQNVSGAHVTSMHYTLHANGVTVDTVTFVALGDLTHGVPAEHGFVGFTVAGVPGSTVDCGTGVYDGTTATTFTCDVTSLAQQVATIQATDIDVSN
ncbi:MAG TPA: hypothetical protein VK771_10285 [Acidimicrobiia bacterium]|jgi:hypothetical protein|nr:hypothetical protein [Acidimicrobiia bacterium]